MTTLNAATTAPTLRAYALAEGDLLADGREVACTNVDFVQARSKNGLSEYVPSTVSVLFCDGTDDQFGAMDEISFSSLANTVGAGLPVAA